MIQSFLKIYKKLNIGYGSCHVTGVNGIRYISRWGIWSTPLTILFSKIHPVSSTVEAIPDKDVWTIQAGFVKTSKVRIKIDNKIYAHKRIFTTGGIDESYS